MTLPMAFRASLLGARPRQARLPQRRRRGHCVVRYSRTMAGDWPGIVGYTHSTPSDLAGATRDHIGKNPRRHGRGRPLIAIDGRMAASSSTGMLSLHVAQYTPCERVSPKPRMPCRSLISVSNIVGPPRRLHSIAISRLRLSFSKSTLNEESNRSRTIMIPFSYHGISSTWRKLRLKTCCTHTADDLGRKAISRVRSERARYHSVSLAHLSFSRQSLLTRQGPGHEQ
jgi:hypothetical protein